MSDVNIDLDFLFKRFFTTYSKYYDILRNDQVLIDIFYTFLKKLISCHDIIYN